MQQQALAWLHAARAWTNKKRPGIHRLLVAALVAPLIVSVVPAASVSQAATSTTTAPQDITAIANGTTLNVTWGAPAYGASAVTAYQVDYSTDGSTWTTSSNAIAPGTYSYGISGLTSGTSYYVRVAAKMGAGTSPWAYPWTKLYGTTTPTRTSNNIVYEAGYGRAATGNQAANAYASASFTRVRYKMQYVSNSGAKFNYVSTDFTKWSATNGNKYNNGTAYNTPAATITTLEVPDGANTQTPIQAIASDLTVESSDQSLNVYAVTGRVQIWSNDISQVNGWSGGADGSTSNFDYNDSPGSGGINGYGSFQVHDITNTRNVFSWNRPVSTLPDIGIGNSPTCGFGGNITWIYCGQTSGATYYNTTNRDNWKLETFINVPTKMVANGLLMRFDAKNSSSYPGTGTTWTDVSGNGITATLTSASQYTTTTSGSTSPANGSFNFGSMMFTSASSQQATINSNFSYDFSGGFSASWYGNFGSTANDFERIFDIANGAGGANGYNIIAARSGTTNSLVLDVYGSSASLGQCLTPNNTSDGIDTNWNHWAVVLNGTNCLFYKNGRVVTNTAYTGLPTSNVARSNAWIGRSAWSGNSFLEGGLADIAFYNRPLQFAEIQNLKEDQAASTVKASDGSCATRVSNKNNVTVTTAANDCLIKFNAPSNTTTSNKWIVPSNISAARVLVVGGGGGGAAHIGGGGGAGGFLDTTTGIAPNSVISVTAGAGGVGGTKVGANATTISGVGANSFFGGLISAGGGGGATWENYANTRDGGSGGGGTSSGGTFPTGGSALVASQGNSGGSGLLCGSAYGYPAAGGGGAGAVGQNPYCPAYSSGRAGDGGIGKASDISGTSTYFAGGGGGGAHNDGGHNYAIFAGYGGLGGGGNGAVNGNGTKIAGCPAAVSVIAGNGTDGLGGGGGGAGANGSGSCNSTGGRGGSGIVFVRYGTTTLSISANNGSGFTGTTSFTTSTYAYLTLPNQSGVTRTGYTFAGWNTSSNGKGTNYAAGSLFQALGSQTFYAQWNSVISYNANGPIIARAIDTTTAVGSEANTVLNNGSVLTNGMVTSGLDLYLDASDARSYSGTGSTWYDLSGNGRNATAVGSPTYDAANGAFNFNGTSQYFNLGSSNFNYQGTQPYTFAAWVKTTKPSKSEQCIVCRYTDSSPNYGSFIYELGSGAPQFYRQSSWYYSSAAAADAATYYYFTVTYDGSKIHFFRNGTQISSTDATAAMIFQAGISTYIGAAPSSAAPRYFEGQMKAIQMYNIALTDGQVLQNYNALLNKSYETYLPSTTNTKAGYTLTGWSTSPSDSSAVISGASYATSLNALPTPNIRLKASDYNGTSWTPTNYNGAGISNWTTTAPTLNTNQTGWGTSASFSTVSGTVGNPIRLGNNTLPNYTFCAMAKWPVKGTTLPSKDGRMFTGTDTNWLDGWYNGAVGNTHHVVDWNVNPSTVDYNWHYYCDTGNDIYLDGVKLTSTYRSYVSLPAISIGGGYWNGSWADHVDYEFSEIIIYDQVLSSPQLDYINRYFKNTYGFESGTAGSPAASLSPLADFASPGNATLYAVWGSTITYDGNGATTGTAPATQVFQRSSGSLATNSGNLALKGKSFTGWNTKADGTGTFYATGASYTGPDLTLYAMFKAPVKITGTTSGSDPITLSPYMRFKASDYNATQKIWYDSSGNGRDTSYIKGGPTVATTTVNQNGSTKTFSTLQGTTSDGVQFKNSLPNSDLWTMFSVARFNGTQATNARIFSGETGDFLFGFYGNNSGVAYYNGWTASNTNIHSQNWVISSGSPDLYRSNGVSRGTANYSDTLPQIAVNAGVGVMSNWQVAEFILFDRKLTTSEIQQVEDYLNSIYGISGYSNQNTYFEPAVINSAANSVTISDTYTAVLGYNNQITISPSIPGITLNTGVNTASITMASTLAVGTYYETITATDYNGNTSTLPIQVNVVNPLIWAAGNPSSVSATYGKQSKTALNISGGYGTRVAQVTHLTSPVPRGVTIDTSTIALGYITLITDTGTAIGTYTESITVTDGSRSLKTILVTITVNGPPDIAYTTATDSVYPYVSTNLVVNLDAGNPSSYSGSGNTWNNLGSWGGAYTLTGSPAFNEPSGGSLNFGPGKYATSNSTLSTALTNYTVEAWFKLNTLNSSTYPCIICTTYVSTNINFALYLDGTAGNLTGSYHSGSWNTKLTVSPALTTNVWYHAAFTVRYDTATARYVEVLYLNGKAVSTASTTMVPAIGANSSILIGKKWDNNDMIDGAIPIAHIYNTALSATQISANYSNTKPRFLSLSAASPTNSGNATVAMTEGKSATYQVFTETGGTGTNTFALSGSNSAISLASVGTDQTSVVVSSSITANSTTAKTYYETLTATDSTTAATAYYITITVNPKISITAVTDTLTTTFGKTAYDTITAAYGTGTLTITRTSGSGSSAITAPVTGNQALLTAAATLPVGSYYETFTVTDSVGATTVKVIKIVVNPALTLTSATGVNQLETTFSKAASLTINVANGTGTRTASALPVTISGVSLTSTNLQNGTLVLSLSSAVAVGRYTETITVTDSVTSSTSIVITIIVNAAPTISYGGATSGAISFVTTKGGSVRTNAFTVLNGTGNKSFALSGLNAGISIDTSTANSAVLTIGPAFGILDTQTARTYFETVTATDSMSVSSTRSFTIIVNPPIIETATATSIATTSGIETSTIIYATKGSGNKTFTLTGTATSGITLTPGTNQATLRVQSTINPGTYFETVTATDTASATTSIMITIVVSPPPSLLGTSRLETSKGVLFKSPLYAISGGTGTLTMSLTNSPANANISLTGATSSGAYLQVGTASETGTYTSTIRVTDLRGAYSEIAVTVVVNDPVTLNGALSITKTYGTSTTNGYSTNGTGTAPFSFSGTPICAVVKTVSGATTYESITVTDSCTWTAPVGVTTFDALLVGAGGGGGADGGSGGGGGSINTLSSIAIPANRQLSVVVGTGGTGGVWSGSNATSGGTTSIVSGSTTFTAPGGSGGGGCGAGASAGGVTGTGSGSSPMAGGNGGYGGTGNGCGAGIGGVGSSGPTSSFTGSSVIYGGGGGGGPYPDAFTAVGLKAGGAGGGGTGTQSSGQSSYGLPIYFRALGGTPSNATSKEAFTTDTCATQTGTIGFSTDSEFPCTQKDNFQGYATGYFIAPVSGSITFYMLSDDSSQLIIKNGGSTVVDLARTGASGSYTSTSWNSFVAGQAYPIDVYFTEIGGLASWKLEYSYSGVSQTVIPLSQFRSGSFGLATYFRANNSTSALSKNTFTSGTCAQVIGNINFANDSAFPCDGKDNFQGYATGYFVSPYTGSITFTTSSDDSSDLVIDVNGTQNELQLSIGSTSATWSGFVKGQFYPISAFFTEISGLANWKLEYEYPGQSKIVIPTDYLRSNLGFVAPTAGTNGLGGGGGAGAAGLYKISGAQGGSGAVVLKYATQSDTATETFITAYVNQISPKGILTLDVPAFVQVGTYTETITVRDAANSDSYTATVTITVNKATPTATLSLPGGVTTAQYGTPVTLSVAASTPGRVAFKKSGTAITGCESVTATSGTATCSWTPNAVESATISALLTPTDTVNYNSSVETATGSTLSILVGKADTLTITANTPTAITYSASMTMPTNGFTASGLKSIDSISSATYAYSTGSGDTCATGGICSVGDRGPAGGVVFYVSSSIIDASTGISTGGLYLEAAPSSTLTSQAWCNLTSPAGGGYTPIGSGAENTRLASSHCSSGAVSAVATLSQAGFSDWFLPSYFEMNELMKLSSSVGMSSNDYWTSSEYGLVNAFVHSTGRSGPTSVSKTTSASIWPIRAFGGADILAGNPTDAGTYYILPSSPVFTQGAASNYTSIQYLPGTLVINKAPRGTWSASYNSGTNLTRYGVGKTETATVTFPGDGAKAFSSTSITCSVDSATGTMTTLGVGACDVEVVLPATKNWLSDTKTVSITIDRGLRTSTITPALTAIRYGDTTTVTSTVSPALDSATVIFSNNSSGGCSVDNITGLVTGIKASTACSVGVTYDQTALYESATATTSITINRALAPVVTTDSITAVSYTGLTAIVSPTYSVTGILARDISEILPTADVSSVATIASIAPNTYTSVSTYRYFAVNPTAYDSATAPTLGGTYAVYPQSLTLLGGLDISNYETPTYVSSNFVIQPIAQVPLKIQLSFLESVTVPFDVTTSGGSSTGARTLAILDGGTATGCAVDSGISSMRLKTLTAGTCVIQVTQAADRNYLVAVSDSQTVNILNFVVNILQLFDNPTGISINYDIPVTKGPSVCTVNCQPRITSVTDASGTVITTMTASTAFRIIGTNFNTTSAITFSAIIGGEEIDADADSFQIDSDTQITVMPPSTFVPNAGETMSNIRVVIFVSASGGVSPANMSIVAISL